MIEEIYSTLIRTTRQYTNSISRNNQKEAEKVVSTLQDFINRITFMLKDDADCKTLENRMIWELKKLSKNMIVKTSNKAVYLSKLQNNIDFLAWVNKSKTINLSSRKYTVAQREIFYAELGDNIGSEQNGRRPVIILQNDVGNAKGNITIVAPVTTHQKRTKWDNEKRKYYVEIIENGIEKRKYLDFYEVPLRLEGDDKGLYGFVNVMHLRAIDRKRIDSTCKGIATENCYKQIIKAINKNLS